MEINATYATTEGTEKVDEPNVEDNRSNGIDITARYSDIDMVDHALIDQSTLLHEVVNNNGDKVICRIHSNWEED
jgi:hypothetical protein